MNTKSGLAAATFAALLAISVNVVADAATVTSWKATLGSSGYNGYATLVTTSTGIGTLRVVARRLTARATYPVELRSGSCTGPRLFALSSAVASSTGSIVKSYPLTAARVTQVLAGPKLYVRIGSSTRVRCGRFALVVPTGATSGVTVKVPASPYGDAAHLHTVQAFESWTPAPDAFFQPAPGDVFVTALIRVDALGPMSYNLFDYHVRDANGLQYGPTIGREPRLDSGDLVAGGFVAGWVTFEVPAGQASSLTLVYSPSYGTTLLVRLTPLPSATPSPNPTPTPACGPPDICLGTTIATADATGLGINVTPKAAEQWAGDVANAAPAGRVFVTVYATVAAKGDAAPDMVYTQPAYTVQALGMTYQLWTAAPGRLPALTSGPLASPRAGWLTFAVPTAVAGQLYLIVPPGVAIRLY